MKEKEKVLLSKNGMGWGAVFERKDENVEIIPQLSTTERKSTYSDIGLNVGNERGGG